MNWGDYSDDEGEVREPESRVEKKHDDGFSKPKQRKVKDIQDDIIVFSDVHDWPSKNYKFVVKSRSALREKLYAERIKFWHGYCPANQQILFKGEDGTTQTMYADKAYQQSLLKCLPKQMIDKYLKGMPGFRD